MFTVDVKKIPIFGFVFGWLLSNSFDYGGLAFLLTIAMLAIMFASSDTLAGSTFSFFFAMSPIWLPFICFSVFFYKWMNYVGGLFWMSQGRSTLRIKLPPEVSKSPEAMEFVLSQVHATQTPDNLIQTYIQGKQPIPMSLEIVSIGGDVRFYVNVPTKKVRNAFESLLYAQYPGVEVIEEPVDYAAEFPLDDKSYEMFSVHMNKKKDQEFPIKTYMDYGLDKLPKEEEKVDPITPMLEVMGSIKPQERLYCQLVCTPFRVQKFEHGQLRTSESPDWTKKAQAEVDKILKRGDAAPVQTDPDSFERVSLSPGERDKVAAIERNADKYAYEVGIRWIYLTTGKFDADVISPMIRSFSQYDILTRNAIGVRWRTDFDYKDYIPGKKKKALDALKRQEFKEYKTRKYFNKNSAGMTKIFTVEELATMFHLPGRVAITPTLGRIPSTRSQAPANLPTGDLPI